MNEKLEVPLEAAARLLRQANRIVCLTGAGVSAESGVATFRAGTDTQSDALWSRFDPQQLASQEGFAANPGMVWQWYMHRLMAVESAKPNDGHRALAQLEHNVPSFTVVTQNVDDLHERGGSRRVLHLHGRINRFRCNLCGFEHELLPAEKRAARPPRCLSCDGAVRPDVVWFGEPLPAVPFDRATRLAQTAEVFVVVGTSGLVEPAASLVRLARRWGAAVIVIDPHASASTCEATHWLEGSAADVLTALLRA